MMMVRKETDPVRFDSVLFTDQYSREKPKIALIYSCAECKDIVYNGQIDYVNQRGAWDEDYLCVQKLMIISDIPSNDLDH